MRDAAIIVAHADVRSPDFVLARDGFDLADELVFADGWFQLHLPAEEDVMGAGQVDQLVQGFHSNRL